jgi:hypothetical protein
MKESTVEQYLCKEVKRIGGMCLKMTGVRGIPDRLVIFEGECVFVELKSPNGKLGKHQGRFIQKLTDQSIAVCVMWNKDHVDQFIRETVRIMDEINFMLSESAGALH